MLCISLRPGDYFTVGNTTVVQFDRLNGERIHLMIHAPQTIPVIRGEVLERDGGERPACVRGRSRRYVRQLPWNHAKKQALAELRQVLAQMDDSAGVQVLREKLEIIFPPFAERKEEKELETVGKEHLAN